MYFSILLKYFCQLTIMVCLCSLCKWSQRYSVLIVWNWTLLPVQIVNAWNTQITILLKIYTKCKIDTNAWITQMIRQLSWCRPIFLPIVRIYSVLIVWNWTLLLVQIVNAWNTLNIVFQILVEILGHISPNILSCLNHKHENWFEVHPQQRTVINILARTIGSVSAFWQPPLSNCPIAQYTKTRK